MKPKKDEKGGYKQRQLENYMKQFQQTKQAFLPNGSLETGGLDAQAVTQYKTAVTEALKVRTYVRTVYSRVRALGMVRMGESSAVTSRTYKTAGGNE